MYTDTVWRSGVVVFLFSFILAAVVNKDYRQRSLRILERERSRDMHEKNTEFLHMYFTRFYICSSDHSELFRSLYQVAWVFMASLKKNAEFIGADA